MTANDIAPAELIALAKDLNRQLGDLNAQVNTLRAQLLEAARQARARDRARQCRKQRSPTAPCSDPSPAPARWHFGPELDLVDLHEGYQSSEVADDARE